MDAQESIREARRLLASLIETGEMLLKSGRIVSPKDDVFVAVIERMASRKLEEKVETPTVEDFTPQGTHHMRLKDDSKVTPEV